MQKKHLSFLGLLFSYSLLIAQGNDYGPGTLYKPKFPENFTVDVNEQGLALIGGLYTGFYAHKLFLNNLKNLINEGLEKCYITEAFELTEVYVAFSMLSTKALLFDRRSSIKSLIGEVWPASYSLARICSGLIELRGKYFYTVNDWDEPIELLQAIILELQDTQEFYKTKNNEFYSKLSSILYDFFVNARANIIEHVEMVSFLDFFTILPAIRAIHWIKTIQSNMTSYENGEG